LATSALPVVLTRKQVLRVATGVVVLVVDSKMMPGILESEMRIHMPELPDTQGMRSKSWVWHRHRACTLNLMLVAVVVAATTLTQNTTNAVGRVQELLILLETKTKLRV
jgi:hypothetical protein